MEIQGHIFVIDIALQIISVALGVSGFVVSLLPRRSTKTKVQNAALIAGLVAFSVAGAALIWQQYEYKSKIELVGNQIIGLLGKNSLSIDQIHEAIAFENLKTISDALSYLVVSEKVGHHVIDVRDDANLRYRTRLFYNIEGLTRP